MVSILFFRVLETSFSIIEFIYLFRMLYLLGFFFLEEEEEDGI